MPPGRAVVAALLALAVASVGEGPRARLLAGAIVGLALLFRQDVGVYALVGVLVASRSAWPAVGLAIVVGPAALILMATVAVNALYEQLIWYPFVGPRVYRAVPDPLMLASGPAAVLLMIVLVWRARANVAAGAIAAARGRDAGRAGLVVFAVLCQLQTLGRGDFPHFAQAAGPAFLCLAGFAARWTSGGRWRSASAWSVVGLRAVTAATTSPVSFDNAESYQASIEHAVAYIRDNTTPSDPIFVGLKSNRYAFVNPLMVYYLADRPPVVRDTLYDPGVTNRASTQNEMVADLDSSNTRYLVLDRVFAAACEPFNASCDPGSTRLDEYIASRFTMTADFGEIVVLVRP